MRSGMVAASVASALIVASLAGLAIGVVKENPFGRAAPVAGGDGADTALLHHGIAGDHATSRPGMERPLFPQSEGSVPTPEQARSLEEIHHIRIHGDGDFNPANGVRSGKGTLKDPYVISGYYVPGDLYISDTDACFEVKNNFIGGQLTLNWNGQCTFVHHNFIRDLRVNENVDRTGYATGGLLEQNKIEFIGQLRHYDGEFRHNLVGPRTANSAFDMVLETVPFLFIRDPRVANVDGFNQGLIHHNTFHGSVDLDFHGHHHGTGFFSPHSHYHGMDEARIEEHAGHEDHTDRWTSVAFTDNKVIDPEGYGLRYEDENHAGDDRTANSEYEHDLDMPHVHHVYVEIKRNTVEGAPLWVDIFIADDDLHHERSEGWLDIEGNLIAGKERDRGLLPFWGRWVPNAGIEVFLAKQTQIRIADNVMTWEPLKDDGRVPLPIVGDWFYYEQTPTAIRMWNVRDATIEIEGNTATGFEVGVAAQEFDDRVTWSVLRNDFGDALKPLYYDSSVANEPRTDE